MRSSRRTEVSLKSSAQQLTDHNIGTGVLNIKMFILKVGIVFSQSLYLNFEIHNVNVSYGLFI